MATGSHQRALPAGFGHLPDTQRLLRVAHCGSVSDINFNGGCPYFVWNSLAHAGLRVAPHDLVTTADLWVRRLAWRARELLALRGGRGYMFTNRFLEMAWSRAPE